MGRNSLSKRCLNKSFMDDLKNGILKSLLDSIHSDNTLDLEIRKDYINIYYRGGNLIKLSQKDKGYIADFDSEYIPRSNQQLINDIQALPKNIDSTHEIKLWLNSFPKLKQVMDNYFTNTDKSEREFQQLIVRENNYSRISNDTDYFIVDIEYTNSAFTKARFDLVAIRWDSKANIRKAPTNCKLALIEMKYSDFSLEGTASIKKHIDDIEEFIENEVFFSNFKNEIIELFKQKRELGLIKGFGEKGNCNPIDSFSNEKPEFILLMANHKPARSKLFSILNEIKPMKNADLKFATANFMGYGLYAECIYDYDSFKELFSKTIYSKL